MFHLSLFLLGFTSLIAQVVITRELMVSLYGNEFFVGWILAAWLFWIGLGSWSARRIFPDSRRESGLVFCVIIASLLIPLEIALIRLSPMIMTASGGQIPDLIPALAVALIIPAPLCFVFGLQFSVACRSMSVGRAYFSEVLGCVAGGMVFTYGLVSWNEFQISSVLLGINASLFLTRAFFKIGKNQYAHWAGAILLGMFGLFCYAAGPHFNLKTENGRFRNETIVAVRNTVYGQITATRAEGLAHFYQNGQPVGPDQNDVFKESLVHLPMLSHSEPKKVLLIGTGFNGSLGQILKHNPAEIFYAEPDPAMLTIAEPLISPESRLALRDPRVHLMKGDLRAYLAALPTDMDVVIVNLPAPSTALINRYATQDFFRQIRSHMKPDAVFSTHLSVSSDTVLPALADLEKSLHKTIKSVFPFTVVLPEDDLFWIASPGPLIKDPAVLVRRMAQRSIRNDFVSEQYLRYRYANDRVLSTQALLNHDEGIAINRDIRPSAYFYNLIFWFSRFHPGLAGALRHLMNVPLIVWLGLALAVAAGLFLRRPNSTGLGLTTAAAVAGFSVMSAEVLVIYAYQIYFGHLYYKIAAIFTVFLAGLAAGTLAGNRNRDPKPDKLVWAFGCSAFLLAALAYAIRFSVAPPEGLLFFCGLALGGLAGVEFSYSTALYRQAAGERDAAVFYATDLFGSGCGALITGCFLIPVYGMDQTLIFVAVINAATAILISGRFNSRFPGFFRRRRRLRFQAR
ncbi:MAG: hypothetical protein HQL23_03595 [Candidatus Omnitrophica bacterium]|nr:hypothetical protein [Candidatus Omnitrophota bacterium]